MLDNPTSLTAPALTLAEFAAGLTLADIPAPVLDRAKLLILDALGCAVASNAYPFSHPAIAAALALGGPGECSVIGRPERLPVRDAAMANGILLHGLGFDDTHLGSIIHATATCLLQGAFGLADLLPPALARADVLALAAISDCVADLDSLFPRAFSGGVRLHLRDGTTRFHHVPVNSGAGERALAEAGVVRKFMGSATMVLPHAQAERIRDTVLTLERSSAADLAAVLRTDTKRETDR